jgi:hypothetical protein
LKKCNSEDRIQKYNAIVQQFENGEIERLIEKFNCFKMFTWDEIRALNSEFSSFQSHGVNHEIHHENQLYSTLEFEILFSK